MNGTLTDLRDGTSEERATPACRCGHYSHEHRNRERTTEQSCYLCDCMGISPPEAERSREVPFRGEVD